MASFLLAITLPSMLVVLARCSRDSSFVVLATHRGFWAWMAAGSILGVALSGLALGWVPGHFC